MKYPSSVILEEIAAHAQARPAQHEDGEWNETLNETREVWNIIESGQMTDHNIGGITLLYYIMI